MAFVGFSCFHLTRYFDPLKMTAGGMDVPSAQIVTITVIFSLFPVFC